MQSSGYVQAGDRSRLKNALGLAQATWFWNLPVRYLDSGDFINVMLTFIAPNKCKSIVRILIE